MGAGAWPPNDVYLGVGATTATTSTTATTTTPTTTAALAAREIGEHFRCEMLLDKVLHLGAQRLFLVGECKVHEGVTISGWSVPRSGKGPAATPRA